jgi:dipeptidyl-peptidase 4
VYPYALPGDSAITTFDVYVIDVKSRQSVHLDVPSSPYLDGPASTFTAGNWQAVKWSSAADRLFVLSTTRGSKSITLLVANPSSGHAQPVVGDSSASTTLDLSSGLIDLVWEVPDDGRTILWFSWRDGWGHVYRFTGDGKLRNRVTTGPWTVDKICFVDERSRRIYLTARGREPGRFVYHSYLYRVNFDGSGLRLLTPEDADHIVSFSPNGKYFVDTWSRVDRAPITALRSAGAGRIVRELEHANTERLNAVHWTAPEVFRVTAADGVTDIYGLMYKPSDFDSTKSYPIIDHIYPVPSGAVHTWGFPALGDNGSGDPRALAELGFIVVEIVGRGTWFRSKAFRDAYQGHMGQNTLPDHVVGIRQLAVRHRWIDVGRVGIYGLSGGGFAAAAGMLRYPEFFKVGIAMAGNHDNRSYSVEWGERFQGLLTHDPNTGKDNYQDEANYVLAKNLKGRLLLMHGDMDDNVHPSLTLRLVHALIEANKDFDLLILPGRGHVLTRDPYVIRRIWDYFVRYLLNADPPTNYRLAPPASP